jgi:hypothetical protein
VSTDHDATHAWTIARSLSGNEAEQVLASLRAAGADAIAVRLDDDFQSGGDA